MFLAPSVSTFSVGDVLALVWFHCTRKRCLDAYAASERPVVSTYADDEPVSTNAPSSASASSRSALSLEPHVSLDAPTSGLIKP